MFLRKKEDILSESSQVLIKKQLAESSYNREVNALLERLGLPQGNISLSEDSFITTLNEVSEDDLKEKFERLKKEVNENKDTVIKNRNIAVAMAWWALGLYCAAVLLTLLSPILGILVLIASIITSIISAVHSSKAHQALEKLKGSLPKIRSLKNRAKDNKLKDRIVDLESRVEEIIAKYAG